MAIAGNKGGTIIEMLVVVSIFAIVVTVLLFNYSSFITSVGVRNLAQEIGLSVRKAQTYATSVRNITGTSGVMSDTFPAYGISFSVDPTGSAYVPSSTAFTLFVDTSATNDRITNNRYDNDGVCGTPAVGQECVEHFSITTGTKIVSLCTDSPTPNNCFTTEHGGTVNVVFHRPNPDAVICVIDSNGNCLNQHSSYLKVTVESPKGLQRLITIWNTGQISVN